MIASLQRAFDQAAMLPVPQQEELASRLLAEFGEEWPVSEDLIVRSREDLIRKLDEGMNSGPPVKIDNDWWGNLEKRVLSKVSGSKS
ncbi:hypothetical protein BH11PLA2_BH11PLA2_08920 [soil metagenome]